MSAPVIAMWECIAVALNNHMSFVFIPNGWYLVAPHPRIRQKRLNKVVLVPVAQRCALFLVFGVEVALTTVRVRVVALVPWGWKTRRLRKLYRVVVVEQLQPVL